MVDKMMNALDCILFYFKDGVMYVVDVVHSHV